MSEYQRTEYPKNNTWGKAWLQKEKNNPKAPDFTGNLESMGEPLKVSIWNNSGILDIKARPMTDAERENYYAKKAEMKAKREAEANRNTEEIRQKIEPVKPKTPMPDPNIDDEIPF